MHFLHTYVFMYKIVKLLFVHLICILVLSVLLDTTKYVLCRYAYIIKLHI